MDQIITDEASKQIQLKVNQIRHHLDLIEKNPSDFKYIKMVTKWIQTDADLMEMFSETVLQWED